MSCLAEQTIAQYLEAELDKDTTSFVEQHIDGCATCRVAIAEAARGRTRPSGSLPPPSISAEGPRAMSPAPILLPGAQLGRYIVRRVVGVGGMGLVYAAYDPNLQREVALKLLRPELTAFADERRLPERLLREAQLMARLTHPNVITVYDVGVLDGQVFVSMELVVGETLGQKLRGRGRRAWREVLALFLSAGRALSAAHRMRVIHRDFKPDNVLVSHEGWVRVTDFGLAHVVLGEELGENQAGPFGLPGTSEGLVTRTGALVGTLAYMAPEQLRGGKADERSDQFAFCVSLYEGLYGGRPFIGSTPEALAAAIEKGAAVPRDSRVPAWLRRVLLRGLRASPSERWPSMDALIHALAHNPMERLWRALLAVPVLMLVAVAGAVAQRAQPPVRTCLGAAARFREIWDAARRQAVHRAFAATKMPYAEDAFTSVAHALDLYGQAWTLMYTDACEATWKRGEQSAELLDLRMHCLEKQRQQLQALVAVYESADVDGVRRAASAAPLLAELRLCADTLGLLMAVRAPGDPMARARITALEGRLAALRARYQAGQYQPVLKEALLLASESAKLDYPPLQAEAELLLGDFQQAVGELADAESSFYRALWAGESGKQDRIVVQAWTRLAYLVGYHQDRAAESRQMVQHAEAKLRRLGGSDIEKATLESMAGNIAFKSGLYDEALRRFAISRPLFEASFGPDSLEVAEVLQRTSFALEPSAQWEEAIAMERRGLDIFIRRLGLEHPEVAAGRLRLGEHLMLNEYYTKALVEVREALRIYQRSYPEDDIHVASALLGVANVLLEMERGREALPLAERALYIREQRLGRMHSDVAEALATHSAALRQSGQTDQALSEGQRVRAIRARTLGTSHVKYFFALMDLGHIYMARREYNRAMAAYRESLAALRRSHVTDVWCFARAQLGVARAELKLHHISAAIALLEETLDLLQRFDPSSLYLGDTSFQLAEALALARRDEPRVKELAQRALTVYLKVEVVRDRQRAVVEKFLAQRSQRPHRGSAP